MWTLTTPSGSSISWRFWRTGGRVAEGEKAALRAVHAPPRDGRPGSCSDWLGRALFWRLGLIVSEAVLDGYEPVVVHGYGLVVGLDGTGSSDIPPDVRAHMIAMASRNW